MNETRLKQLLPNASKDTIALNLDPVGGAQGSFSERAVYDGPVGQAKGKTGHTGCSDSRYQVRVISYRQRLLDEDNLIPKYFIDSLRYCGVLPSDAPDKTHITTTQKKVETKQQEKTIIEIDIPNT